MPAKLSPEERDRRAKERRTKQWAKMNSGEAYKHYDVRDGLGAGSEEQWRNTADVRIHGKVQTVEQWKGDLSVLGLDTMPSTITDLRRAYRLRSRYVHPDTEGGSNEAFRALTEAFERLEKRF